jgi:hypothetical protein
MRVSDQEGSPSPLGQVWQHLRVVWTHPIHFVLALFIGAVGSFVYSYGPLHRAEQWQIGYLEERVDEQNAALRTLEAQLAQLEQQASTQPDPEDLASERSKAQSAKRDLASARKELERSERTIKSLRHSVGQWKSKYAKAQAEAESLRQTIVAGDSPAPAPGIPTAPPLASDAPGSAGEAPAAAPDPAEIP